MGSEGGSLGNAPISTRFLSLLNRFFHPSQFDLLKFSDRPGEPHGHTCPPPLHGAQPWGLLGIAQPAPFAHQRHGAALLRHQLPDGASRHVWTVHPRPRIRSWQPTGECPAGWLSWGGRGEIWRGLFQGSGLKAMGEGELLIPPTPLLLQVAPATSVVGRALSVFLVEIF